MELPYRVLPRRTALEQLVTAQPLPAIFRAAQTGSPNRHLLPGLGCQGWGAPKRSATQVRFH